MDLHAEAKRAFAERIEHARIRGAASSSAATSAGDWLQVYWIMGRSENSRNRRFVAEGGDAPHASPSTRRSSPTPAS